MEEMPKEMQKEEGVGTLLNNKYNQFQPNIATYKQMQPNTTKGRVRLPNRMNFWKSAKEGWVIFNPKIYIADFGNFKQGFLSMKLIKRRVTSGFRVCFFNNCIDIN